MTVDTVDQDILDGLPDMTKSRSRSAPDITSDSSNKSIYVPVKSRASGKTFLRGLKQQIHKSAMSSVK